MNLIALIILITFITDFILHFLSDFLNIKSANTKLPDRFKDLYDSHNYEKSQQYLKSHTKFGWILSSFNLILILCFWFARGFELLDQTVRSFNYGPVLSGLIFIGILSVIKIIITLPFNYYSTFVIEEKFGFNKTTHKIFILDTIKKIILSLILGGVILAAILAFFEYAGALAWLYCWAAMIIFVLLVQYIVPTWIMPLFNKFTPLEEGELKDAVMTYAKSINFSLQNIFVMDGSKRSTKSNAFFTGFGKNKRIVLFDTLIEKHTTDELLAVLAHEMGHFKKKHILKNMILSILHTGIILYFLSLFISNQLLFDAFFMQQKSIYAGLIFFSMLYAPVEFLLGIVLQIFSRKNEYEADKFAVKTTNKKKPLADALQKLSVNNLSNLTPHPLYVFLNYSHPPLLKRVEAIENIKIK